ncbi:MAG: hypothetical protein ACHRHE_10175, partial [Tepidisphaerales bacterium]
GGALTAVNNLTVNGAGTTTITTPAVTTAGFQSYGNPVTLSQNTVLTGTALTLGAVTGGGFNLTLTGSGLTTLGGPFTTVNNLTVNGSGTTTIATPVLTTAGFQTYGNAVTLAADASLVGTSVTFNGTVNGAFALAIGNAGTATGAVFGNGAGAFVGNTGAGLTSLHVFGTTALNAGNTGSATVRTTGTQTYDGAVALNDNTTLVASQAGFNGPVTGSKSLLVTGATAINGASVTTTGATQEYTGPVTLGANAALTGTTVTFDAAVSGSKSLLVTGSTVINGGAVATTGTTQEYNGPVALGANATLTGSQVTFDQAVNGDKSLLVNGSATIKGGDVTTTGTTQEYNGSVTLVGQTVLTGSTVIFDQQVDGDKALRVLGNTQINGAGVATQNAQEYQGTVTLGHNATLQTRGTTSGDYILFGGNVAGHTADNRTFYDLTLLTVPASGVTDAQIFFIAPDVSGKDVNVSVGRLFVNNDGKNDLRTAPSQFASICVIAGTPSDQKEYTGNYVIQAHPGLIEISRNERLTALGSLDVRADTAHLSDITTLKDLNIFADSILLKRHKSAPLAVAGGGAAPDNGASYVAGAKFIVSAFQAFPSSAVAAGARLDDESTGSPHSADPAIRLNAQDLANLIGNPAFSATQVTAGSVVSPVTIDQLRKATAPPAVGSVFALEAKATPVPLQPVVVLNQVQVIAATTVAASDSAVGKLEELGIIKFKPPTTQPSTLGLYDDVPVKMASGGGVEATDFLLTRNRIKQDVAEKLIALFYQSFPSGIDKAGKPTDPFVEMKTELEKAAAAYKKENKLKTIDSTARFRQFVNSTPGMEKAKLHLDRMRNFFNAVYPVDAPTSHAGAGLSMREAEASRRLFMSKLESSGEFEQITSEQVIYAVFDKDAPPRKAKPEKKDVPEKK